MAKRTKLDIARQRNELARLELDTAWRERALRRLAGPKAKWDATEGNRFRRQPVVEVTGEGDIYDMRKRGLGANLGRDLERNYPPARGILHQFRMNVVGALGKLQVNVKGGDEAAAWFNQQWAADMDFRDDCHWSTHLQNVVASVVREGDMLAIFDDGIVENSGKVLTWEADQIVPLAEKTLQPALAKYGILGGSEITQDNGILRDKYGRVLAFVATGKRGITAIDRLEDATIYRRGVARLPRNPWRLNQGRGVPSVLTSATNFQDLYEILAKELQSAKRAASQYAAVKRGNPSMDADDPTNNAEFLPENAGKDAATVAAEPAGGGTDTTQKNLERLESFTGGFVDYMMPDEELVIPDINRPNIHLAEFIEAVHGHAGASMGLARAYTILRADSSYTSFRGDMILSWVTFHVMQKWLEREYADWMARRALAWAQKGGQVKVLPAGWEYALSWTWPTMPEVDELDAENAIAAALKNGTTDFAKLLGPDWQKRLSAYAEQVAYVRQLMLPLGILDEKYGGGDNPKKDGADGDG